MRIVSLPTWPLGIPRFTSAGKRFSRNDWLGDLGALSGFGTTLEVLGFPNPRSKYTVEVRRSRNLRRHLLAPYLTTLERDCQ
jgi:hypothetical protein